MSNKEYTDKELLDFLQSLDSPVLEVSGMRGCRCGSCFGWTLYSKRNYRKPGYERSYSEDGVRGCIAAYMEGETEKYEEYSQWRKWNKDKIPMNREVIVVTGFNFENDPIYEIGKFVVRLDGTVSFECCNNSSYRSQEQIENFIAWTYLDQYDLG